MKSNSTFTNNSVCHEFQLKRKLSSLIGTRENTPPEYILNGEYEGPKEAVWTSGLLLYYLVCGDEPFCSFQETTMKPLQVPCFLSSGKLYVIVLGKTNMNSNNAD